MIEFSKEAFPDSRCFIIYDKVYIRHRTGNHPEHPQRLIAITRALEECEFSYMLDWVAPVKADLKDLLRVHSAKYIETVKSICGKAGDAYVRLDIDTVVTADSYEAALYAAGGMKKAVDLALGSRCSAAFAPVRPPGHHAMPDRSMGFCIFNNIAIAAKYALEEHNINRILIIDWDLHHGNGLQDVFYSDKRVFYISLHQTHHFPGTGYAEEIGDGAGRGYNLNLPLHAGCGDSEYAYCFTKLVGPIAMAYKPELIIIAGGFDAHSDDPLGLMCVTSGEYGRLAYYIRCIARETGAKIAISLEGGYDLNALQQSVLETVHSLVMEKPDDLYLPKPFKVNDDVQKLVSEQIERFSEFWDIDA